MSGKSENENGGQRKGDMARKDIREKGRSRGGSIVPAPGKGSGVPVEKKPLAELWPKRGALSNIT